MGQVGRVIRGMPGFVWRFLAAGAICFGFAAWMIGRMEHVRGTEAFRLPVDLSTVGVYRATVRESHPKASYRETYFRTDPRFHSSGELSDAMHGGRAVLRVTDPQGKEFLSEGLDGVSRGRGGEYIVIGGRVFTHGVSSYTVEVDVTERATGLAGRKQEVVGVYEYWTEDTMPAGLVLIGGMGCWLVAGIGAVSVAMGRRSRATRQGR